MARPPARFGCRFASLVLAVLSFTGCAATRDLMPTPNLYARGGFDPFADVPPSLRTDGVDVFYTTDRERTDSPPGASADYGHRRSRSVAFGIAHVRFGNNLTWDQLAAASRTGNRRDRIPMTLTQVTEYGRSPPTPRNLLQLPADPSTQPTPHAAPATNPDALRAQADAAYSPAQRLLSQHLALTPTKDVYLFVHGYNSDFADSVQSIAELWHFLGRRGVPVAYSWPAGHAGLLRGYTYDRESGEFTVHHLKEVLRQIAANPDVHRVHVVAHSRGTDVAVAALRELHLELGAGRDTARTRRALKLGTLVLAAPDVDFDVIVQRAATVQLQYVPERTVIYVSAGDDALGLSNWLFGGTTRLGALRSTAFSPAELTALRTRTTFEIVDCRVSHAGEFNHLYYAASPAVSSDLVLLLRYHLPPGPPHGRPLKVESNQFWTIDDNYPTPATQPPAPTTAD